MPRLPRILTFFVLIVSVPLASATTGPDQQSSYDIEVLVFESRSPELQGDELLTRAADSKVQALENAETLEPLPGETFFHPSVTTLLANDSRYRLLARHHWVQTLEPNPKTAVKPVRILASNPDELEGTVKFSMSRFLHLDVNLLYRDSTTDRNAAAVYRISEQRRVKSQETHYFDHPRFGVLVRIMPLDKDGAVSERARPDRRR